VVVLAQLAYLVALALAGARNLGPDGADPVALL